MIDGVTEWFGNQFSLAQTALDGAIAGAIPAPPAALVEAAPCAVFTSTFTQGDWVGRFLPFPALGIAVLVLGICIVAAIAIRVSRIALSLATFGGGA